MSFRRYPSTSSSISGNVNVQVLDANGNPILSTIDPYSLKNGLDVNLLESGIIGDVGQPLSAPYSDAAMAIAFNNGGTLQVPNMDVADGTLIVDATQKGNVPVNLTALNGGGISYSNPIPTVLTNPATGDTLSVGAGTADADTLRVINFPTTSAGLAQDYGGGATSSATQRVVIATDQTKLPVYQPNVSSVGTITGTQSFSIACNGAGTVGAQIAGVWVGTITVEGTVDGSNWFSSPSIALSSGGSSSNYSANNVIQINCSGLLNVRLRGNTISSGTATITLIANQSAGVVMLENPIPSGSNIIGKTYLTDGTNQAAVKAASTAPVATDPALVVSLSPNSAVGLLATSANQTSGTQLTRITDGTNQAAVKGSSTAPIATDPSLVVTISPNSPAANILQTDLSVTGQSAQTAVINNIIPVTASASATDATGYKSGSIQVVSTGTAGTFIFEQSNDNVNFQTMPVYNQVILTGTPVTAAITATASQIIYTFPIQARYIRLRIATLITGGSIQAFTRLSQAPWSPAIMQVGQNVASNLNATVSGNLGTVTTVTAVTSITNNVNVKQVNALGTFVRNDYTTTNVTTGAYVQLIASTAAAYNAIEIFDSSGQTLQLALGASGSEVNQFLIFPGGNGRIPYTIAAASRVSVKAVSGTANVGELSINFYV